MYPVPAACGARRTSLPSIMLPGMMQVICLPLITLFGLLSPKPTIAGNDIAE